MGRGLGHVQPLGITTF